MNSISLLFLDSYSLCTPLHKEASLDVIHKNESTNGLPSEIDTTSLPLLRAESALQRLFSKN